MIGVVIVQIAGFFPAIAAFIFKPDLPKTVTKFWKWKQLKKKHTACVHLFQTIENGQNPENYFKARKRPDYQPLFRNEGVR